MPDDLPANLVQNEQVALEEITRQETTLPVDGTLLVLNDTLPVYVNIGANQKETEGPDLLGLVERLPLPTQADRLQTLLVLLFGGICGWRRRGKRKPAAGGWKQPNRFTRIDEEQWFYDQGILQR